MRTYVDVIFPLEGGKSALKVAELCRRELGLDFLQGRHDLVFEWKDVKEFEQWVDRFHRLMKGAGILYRLITVRDEEEGATVLAGWPPVVSPLEDGG
jgi:hypothetical protein